MKALLPNRLLAETKYFLIAVLSLLSVGTIAQTTVNMSATTINGNCNVKYYDHAGASNYSNSQNTTQTFYPAAGKRLVVKFTTFSTESNYDFLYIYDGNSIAAPQLAKLSGTPSVPFTYSSTAADGSLTFRFVSDISTTRPGWIADITCEDVPYRAKFISANTGASAWCPGETRTISVQIQNTGSATWTNSSPDVNIGVKWDANGSDWTDYHVRTDANNLAPGATGTFYFNLTASNIPSGTPLAPGANNISFDVVREAVCWFANNGGVTSCGPGNSVYSVPVTISNMVANPVTGISGVCSGNTIQLNSNASGPGTLTYTWFSTDATKATVNNSGLVTGVSAGNTNIYYTVSNGSCSATSALFPITVNGPTGTLTATENSGTPNDNKICFGDNIKFTASAGFNAYTFKVNNVVKQSGTSNIFNTTTLNNGDVVTVEAVNSNNCMAILGPVTITVNPLPTGSLAATENSGTANDNIICAGSTVNFTATAGFANYVFSVNGSELQTGASNIFTSSVLQNGDVVTVSVTNSNGCKTVLNPVTITVLSLPASTISVSENSGIAANDNIVCAGDNVTFTATAGYSLYNFKVNGTSMQNSASNIFSSSILTNPSLVSVDVTGTTGCAQNVSPVLVEVKTLPSGTLSVIENSGIANDGIICENETISFSATAGFVNYNFKVNNLSVQSGNSNIYSPSSLNNGDVVSVEVTGDGGCKMNFNSVNVTILNLPSGSLTADRTSVCPGEAIVFTAPAGYLSYSFSINGSVQQNGSSSSFTTSVLNNGDVVTVLVNSSNGCSTTLNTISITVNNLPSGSLTASENSGTSANDNIICEGENIIFTATAGYSNYEFFVNGSSVQSGSSNVYSSTSITNGSVIRVEVTNSSLCKMVFNELTVTVLPSPVVNLIANENSGVEDDMIICATEPITFTADAGFVNYTFYVNNIAVQSSASNVFTTSSLTLNSNIKVEVTNANNCKGFSNIIAVTVNSLPTGSLTAVENSGLFANDGKICISENIDFTATAGYSNYEFFLNGSSVQSGASNVYSNSTLSNGDVVSVTVTGVYGCTSTFAAVTVQVNAPTALPAISGAGNVCVNSNIVLYNAVSPGEWTSSDDLIASVDLADGTVTGVSAGTATIKYSYTNEFGCTSSTSENVIVNGLPTPTLAGPNPFCPNTIAVYTTEDSQSNYVWTVTGGTIVSGGANTDNTVEVNWNLPGAKTVFVNYTDANGCSGATSSTVVASSGTVPVVSGNSVVCQNSEENVYTTQSGQTDYTWTVTGGTITSGGTAGDNSVTIKWNTYGNQSVKVNFTDIYGCTPGAPVSYPVKVNPAATASLTGTASVCLNAASPVIKFTGLTGLAPFTFTYNINNGPDQTISTVSGAQVTLPAPTNVAGVFVYNLTNISDSRGCGSNVSLSATVTVNNLPTATISGSTEVCNGTPAVITFTGNDGVAPYRFYYTLNGGPTLSVYTTTNVATVNVPLGTPNTYTYSLVSVQDSKSCNNIQTGTAVVKVNPMPTATVFGATTVCQNSSEPNVTFSGSNGTAPYTFNYTINGAPYSAISSGNDAIVPVPTNVAGNFTYSLVSVTDASATTCTKNVSGSVIVKITAESNGGIVSGTANICSGVNGGNLTLSGHTGSVVRWETSTTSGTSWVPVSNTSTTFSYSNLTQTTWVRAVVQNGICGTANSAHAVLTVVSAPAGGIVSSNMSVCSGTNSGTLTLSGHSGSVTGWESSVNGGALWSPIANTSTTLTFSNISQATMYRAIISNGVCAPVRSAAATVSINVRPVATLTGPTSVCNGSSANLIINVTGTGTISGFINGSIPFSGTAPTISVAVSPTVPTSYSITSLSDANCSATSMTGTVNMAINALPATFSVTPSSATLCQDNIIGITSSGAPTTVTKTASGPGGNIPDATTIFFGLITIEGNMSSSLSMTGIPAGAIINNVRVNFNVNHTYDGDLVINLRAPNSQVLNLVNRRGGSGNNFTNTTVSSAAALSFGSASAPFTNTFAPDGANATATVGSTVNNFTALYGTPNGTWTLYISDFSKNDAGSLLDWTLYIDYTVPSTTPVKWSPLSDLYSDASATVPYTGNAVTSIYVKPSSGGTKVYTATLENGAGCTSTATATLNVNSAPTITTTTDYCSDPGKVRITASASPASTFIWNTGATTNYILVDQAGTYSVTATTAAGCKSSASANIAQELIINGDFEQGNVGFTSAYGYVNAATPLNMVPEGIYTVDNDAHYHHNNFYGKDHTTGTGNFMIVNGSGSPVNIWQQTVTVLPNTTYYFSAWAASLNNVAPYAQLQFNVNGTLVGTTAVLTAGPSNTSTPLNWVRFYGTWTSGPAVTSAVVSIRDLQTALGGNDFGLDDISFGTLSTFIQLMSSPSTVAQTPCVNTAITPIVYSVGSGGTGPTVTGLPAGVTGSFNGSYFTISGTPTVPGDFTYTITTTGTCNPTTATGTISVKAQTISLLSGSTAALACSDQPMADVKYTIGGSATGASITGLPAGLSVTYNAGVFTISGTPSVSGLFNYIITTSGPCTSVTKSGSVEVRSQVLNLTSALSTTNQNVCVNTAISNIIYSPSGAATSASATGLPAGVTANFTGGMLVISGTPTIAGTYNYTVTSSGACNSVNMTGVINVNPSATITLTSAAGTNNQQVCAGTAITSISYSLGGGATSANVSGLPSGITGSVSAGIFTISGTSNIAGVYNYTVTTTGTCAQAVATGTITIQSGIVSLFSGTASQSVCNGGNISAVTFAIGGTATGATVSGLPTGITGTYSAGYFTISGSSTIQGTFNYTVTTTGTCAGASAGGTIVIGQAPNGGSVSTVLVCSGNSATVSLSGHNGTVLQWERSDDNGLTWTVLSGTGLNQTLTGITGTVQCRALVQYGSCGSVYSNVGIADVKNVWVGNVNTDWNNPQNWSGNTMPSTDCNTITIPQVASALYPVITTTVNVNNLLVQPNAMLTVSNATLKIGGTLTSSDNINAATGTIELTGTSGQTLNALTFMNNSVNHLIVSNSSTAGVTLNGELDIYGSLTFSASGKNFTTNDNLTMKSTSENTAWVGNLTGKKINGKVTVERYIHSGTGAGQHGKGWQLLAVPTTGSQTINNAWQEGSTFPNQNNKPGYGTMITGHMPNAVAMGFDVYTSAGGTMKTYNANSNNWDGVANTKTLPITNPKGYLLFVRGDRSVITSNAPAKPTVLRTKGYLYSPANPPANITVEGGKFESVGNPYASAIDMTSTGVSRTNMADMFYVWDPQLTNANVNSAYGLGGYQVFTKGLDGNYHVTPGGGSYGNGGDIKNTIESGQAIIMRSSAPAGGHGHVSFNENAKVGGSNLVYRASRFTEKEIRTNIIGIINGEQILLDGVTCQFDESYSNALDELDAPKLGNFGVNFGMLRNGKLLSVERRNNIEINDTIFFNMGQMKNMDYIMEVRPALMSNQGLKAYLYDSYLRTYTDISLENKTQIRFTISSASGSNAAARFMIVFKKVAELDPVKFVEVGGRRRPDNTVAVEWKVANQFQVEKYELERSNDNVNFNGVVTTYPVNTQNGNADYSKNDLAAISGPAAYYRVKAISSNGSVVYSRAVKVEFINEGEIKIYPNPVTNGVLYVNFTAMSSGNYKAELINNIGQIVFENKIKNVSGSITQMLKIGKLAAGHYVIRLTNVEAGSKTLRQVIIK